MITNGASTSGYCFRSDPYPPWVTGEPSAAPPGTILDPRIFRTGRFAHVPQARRLSFDPVAEARRQWEGHGWDEAAPGMAVVTSVMRVQQVFLARIEEILAPLELTFARYEVLVLLVFSRRGALPLGTVGSRLQVHPASVTNAVARLERQGLVRRSPHPRDGRAVVAALTPAGRRAATRATDELNGSVFADLGLSARECSALFRLMAKVRRVAGDF